MCGFAMAIGIGLSVFKTFSEMSAARSEDRQRQGQLDDQIKAEKTTQALEKEDRQRRLQSVIASQKVAFGSQGALIDPNVLASTGEEFGREQYNSDFNSDMRIHNIFNNKAASTQTRKNKVTSSLFSGAASVFGTATNPDFT